MKNILEIGWEQKEFKKLMQYLKKEIIKVKNLK